MSDAAHMAPIRAWERRQLPGRRRRRRHTQPLSQSTMLARVTLLAACLVAASATAGLHPPEGEFAPKCLIGEDNVYDVTRSFQVPWFTVNLDEPAETRYRHVVAPYKDGIPKVINIIKKMFTIFGDIPIMAVIESLMRDAFDGKIQQPYHDEIVGIAAETGVPVEDLAMMNIFYELSRFCTSIVAEGLDGHLYHGRNLDFGQLFFWNVSTSSWALTDALKPLTININFVKNGKLLFKGTTFAGHVGVITAMKPHAFSLSMNAQVHGDLGSLAQWFMGKKDQVRMVMWTDRHVMEIANTYEEAHDYLSSVEMLAGCYFILGGNKPGQGTVIVRNATEAYAHKTLHTGNDTWYVLQTNYDPDQTPLFIDDRRDAGNWCMAKMTQQGLSKENMYKVLASKTTLNKTTAHMVLMSVTKGYYETYVMYCPNPCWFL